MAQLVLRVPALIAAAVLMCHGCVAVAQDTEPELRFRIDEGRNINSFVREGDVAAHLLLRSGSNPRVLVAFPAGNSGVGLWFVRTDTPVAWTLSAEPRAVSANDEQGRALRGIELQATISTSRLDVERAVLSSVRVLREFESLRTTPPEVTAAATIEGDRMSWSRRRLDGAPGYRLVVQVLDDGRVSEHAITAGASGRLRLKISALTGEPPLRPLPKDALLTGAAAADPRSQDVLTFLSYRDKFLAGSWRFNTYFGRDTLMSLTLLANVLQPVAIESGIESVLSRLDPQGEVAHEEDIGEFAVLRNAREGRAATDAPIYDYGMIDDDFMLAPLAARWLLDHPVGRGRARDFLEATITRERNGDLLVRNLCWLVERAARFAADPQPHNLVGIKAGRMTGQWRDSEEGLGRGRYAYDVNAVFVPAALASAERLLRSGLLDSYLSAPRRRTLMQAGVQARAWAKRAPPLFVVAVSNEQARRNISAYAASIGVDAESPLAALGASSLTFNALALDAAGRPIPVMHSDDGFALLFGTPSPVELERSIRAILRPFPAGLWTPIGLLVANPVVADAQLQARFNNAAYHGTVVWSWQQAVLAAGLARQLERSDLPPALRARLISAQSRLWAAIDTARAVRTSELWSWSFANGRYRIEPFGQRGVDEDESNAAQLWSTVYLGVTSAQRRAVGQ